MVVEGTPNRYLVVYALSTLGSIAERFHTEDIAIRCHELFPTSFSWTTRSDLPDKDIVRVALTDARKEKFGALVDGRTGQSRGQYQRTRRGPMLDGWRLSDAGLVWIEANRARFEELVGAPEKLMRASKDHRQASRKKLKMVRGHVLFEEFKEDGAAFSPGIGELADLARCRVDAESSVWAKRFDHMRRLAVETEQDELVRFIDSCRNAYETARG